MDCSVDRSYENDANDLSLTLKEWNSPVIEKRKTGFRKHLLSQRKGVKNPIATHRKILKRNTPKFREISK